MVELKTLENFQTAPNKQQLNHEVVPYHHVFAGLEAEMQIKGQKAKFTKRMGSKPVEFFMCSDGSGCVQASLFCR